MQRSGFSADPTTLSGLLSGVKLRGQSWCYSDITPQSGFSVPPGEAVLFHAVLHGSVRIACSSGEVAVLGRGDAVIVLSGEAHALRTSPEANAGTHEFLREERTVDIPPTVKVGKADTVEARVLSGRLRAGWPAEVNRSSLPSLLRVGQGEGGPLAALLTPEALGLSGMGAGAAAQLTQLASLMLVAGLRADPGCRRLFSPPSRDPIAEAVSLIEADPSASWTVERLARSVGMGRSNFAAHFTQAVGRAPMELVAEKRMEHAAALLRQGNLKIAEIGEMAGYSSEAAFSRRFTRHFGISPSQMRQRAQVKDGAPGAKAARYRSLLSGRPKQGIASLGRKCPDTALPASADQPDRTKPAGHFWFGPQS